MTEWTARTNPIDHNLDACLNNPNNESTAGMANCQIEAQKAWDAELNSVYRQIMQSELSPSEKNQFKQDENKWLEFRDAEQKFIGSVYNHTEGSVHTVYEAGDQADLIKDRVLQLHQRLDMIGDGKDK